ncbi:MAG: hypothetical protein O6929_12895 [candidate division NC10 bacterium]|nr:hypothetical protein [candidate division NC10 bacterium]
MRAEAGRIISSTVFISLCVTLLIAPIALAQRGRNVIMLGLIQRIDRQSREITLWEYQIGDSTWTLQVPGTENMRKLQVGDYVQVMADSSRRVALRIRKLPPPEKDDRYQEAIRRLEAETGKPAQ